MGKLPCLVLIFSLLPSPTARADLTNPNLLPLGEREALLGNSGVAANNSSGSPFYNPAGLAAFSNSRISASGSSYALIEATLAAQEGDPLKFKELNTVPSMLVAARKRGAWTGAFSIFVPVALEVNTIYDTQIAAANVAATLSLYNRAEENYIGVSAGRSITRSWDWGVGLHLHRTRTIKNESVQAVPTSGSLYIGQTKRVKSEVLNLVLVTGLQKQIRSDMRFGLTLQSETLKLQGEAERYEQTLYSLAGTPSTETSRRNYKTDAKIPWQLMTGLEWDISSHVTWQLDFGVSFAATSRTLSGAPDEEVIHTRTTGRVNSGVAIQLGSSWKLLAGASYNPSAVEHTESRNATSNRNNFLGFTAGLMSHEEKVNTGIGLFYLKSRTDRKFFGSAPDDPTSLSIAGVILTTSLAY